MKKAPENDRITEDYLAQRVIPENQNCKGRPDTFFTVGKNVQKPDAFEKVTGAAQYSADIKLPNCLYAKILRSTMQHAKIIDVDISRAKSYPGVVSVITGKDFDKHYGIIPWTRDERPLCKDRVRYIGDEVAAVATTSKKIAEEAIKLIKVTYEELPVADSIKNATNGSAVIHEKHPDNITKSVDLEFGDVDKALQNASVVIDGRYFYQASTHAALEPHAAIARYTHDGHLTIWSSTQTPHYLQKELARLLDMPVSKIRVIKPHLGGAFGGKSEPFAFEFVVALLSKRTGRPVKIVYDREECFLSHRGRHAIEMGLKLGYHPKEGLSLDYKADLDGGAYSSYGMVTTYYSGALNAGLYKINNYRWKSRRYFTNKPPSGPKRGHGAPQPRFAIECLFDRLAEKLKRDPIELRKELMLTDNYKTINQLQIGSSGFSECLDRAATASDWKNKHGKLPFGKGIGVAGSFYISGTNYPINPDLMPQSGIQLKADRSGLITIFTGASDIGQGSDCILRQIVAEELGIHPDFCKIVSADSDLCPVDLGSYSSRVTLMAGNAAISSARHLKHQILFAVSKLWETKPEQLTIAENKVFVRDNPEKYMDFIKALEIAETQFGSLGSTGSYTTPNRGGTYRGALVGVSPAYSFTVQIIEISVEKDTGLVKVKKVWAAHDCGKAINPALVKGQIEGSVHMGIGEALMEKYTFNNGLIETPNLLDYKIPTSVDTPEIEAIIIEAPDEEGPYGAKEAGEGPLLPTTPAIANAIYDAVGIRLTSLPFTPDKVLKALETKS
jgi:4-hydroxybenzoyl-CoA reductase subunit alpha